MKPQPIKYHLEIYEDSFINDPIVSLDAEKAFMAFSKGDLIDPGLWNDRIEKPAGTWYKIDDVVHRVWTTEGLGIGHQIGLCIVATDRPG